MSPNKIKNYEYTGPLAEIISAYIQQKRTEGCQYNVEARQFKRFDIFTKDNNCPRNTLPRNIAEKWIEKKPNEKLLTQIKRTNAVRGFAEFMIEHGFEAYICPRQSKMQTDEYIPHIFTENEIKTILTLADQYQSTIKSPYLNTTVPLAFRILYGCGLRVSEVMNLKLKDIQAYEKYLYVRDSKFRKDRIVPMSASLAKKCDE